MNKQDKVTSVLHSIKHRFDCLDVDAYWSAPSTVGNTRFKIVLRFADRSRFETYIEFNPMIDVSRLEEIACEQIASEYAGSKVNHDV